MKKSKKTVAVALVTVSLVSLMGCNAENAVVNGYTKVENFFVNGYKSVENFFVNGYNAVEDKCVEWFFLKEGETVEEAKDRLSNGNKSEEKDENQEEKENIKE